MAVDDDNSAPVAFPTTEDVTVVEPFAGSSSSFKIPVSCPVVTRCLTPNVINSLLQRSRASVGYLALFAIKGVDTNSREYLKSTRVLPEVTVVTSSSKRPRSSLTTAHNLLSDDEVGTSYQSLIYSICNSVYFLAVRARQATELAIRTQIEAVGGAGHTRAAYKSRIVSLRQDRSDYFFRMTYFHSLYNRALQEIKEAEAARDSLPEDTIELD